jgi:hypothetical protein
MTIQDRFTWTRPGADPKWIGELGLSLMSLRAEVTVQRMMGIGPPIAVVTIMPQMGGQTCWTFRCYVEKDREDDEPCPACNGVGTYVTLPGDQWADCPECLGGGRDLLSKGKVVVEALYGGLLLHRLAMLEPSERTCTLLGRVIVRGEMHLEDDSGQEGQDVSGDTAGGGKC